MNYVPNGSIDIALKKLMKRLDEDAIDPEVAVKIINSAVAWEKVKARILDSGDDFDPDSL